MNRLPRIGTAIFVACGALVALCAVANAQDPAVVNAKTIRVKLDNPQVRVLEAVLQPGDKEAPHSHPAYVVYVVEGGKVLNHLPDGKTSETEFKTGDVLYRDPLTHWAENIGTKPVHFILVELKSSK
jgi:quercetin dioxygenase-like cupin family protein